MVGNHVHFDSVSQREGLIPLTSPATRFHIASVLPMRQGVAGPSEFQVVSINNLECSPQVRHLLKG
jgi:hypothetical protein